MGERIDPGFREIMKGTQEVVITSQEGFVLISMRKVEAQGRRINSLYCSALVKNRQFCAAMSLHSCIRSSDEMYDRKGQLTSVGSMRSNSEPTQGMHVLAGQITPVVCECKTSQKFKPVSLFVNNRQSSQFPQARAFI